MSESMPNGAPRRGRSNPIAPRFLRAIGRGTPVAVFAAFATVAFLVLTSGYAVGAGTPFAHSAAAVPAATGVPASAHLLTAPRAPGVGSFKVPSFALSPGGATSAPAAAAPLAPVSSGQGTFFKTAAIPNPTAGNNTCIKVGYIYTYRDCYNDTNEPSINLTTKGLMAVAYTAFTNQSPCAGTANNATAEVGFSTSTNLGSTWSAPKYLGNPVCKGYDGNFSSAMMPSLTSLANGTLVLSYVEYNATPGTTYPLYYYASAPPNVWCGILTYDRVVVSESYNNGSTWTTPTVMSSVTNITGATCPVTGFPDLQPWVTAIGKTVYLSWMTLVDVGTYGVCPNWPIYGAPVSTVSFADSTNGGSTWSTASTLAATPGSMQYSCYTGTGYTSSSSDAMNPTMTTSPSGELFLAYITGFNETYYPLYQSTAELVVANSTNNGTSWTYHTVDNNTILAFSNCCTYPDVFVAPMPSLAFGKVNHQLYVAWGAGIRGYFCENYGYASYCYNQTVQTIWVSNSSTYGSSWSVPHLVTTKLVDPYEAAGAPYNELYNPSIAVDSAGILHLQASFVNDSLCYTYGTSTFCNGHQQIYTNSTDNGTTWSQPVYVYYAWTPFTYYGPYQDIEWAGQYSTMLAAGKQVFLAWTTEQCPNWASGGGGCYWGGAAYGNGNAEVMVSQKFLGAGLTLTFKETGLKTGTVWSASIMGNYRAAAAPSTLSVSGVPPSQLVSYIVPWVNATWGIAYNNSLFPLSASQFTASSTIYANFSEKVKFTVQTVPTLPYYYWLYTGYSNWKVSPAPASTWISVGATVYENVTPQSFGTYCYGCVNMTFLSWTGSGTGNVTTLSPNITLAPTAPVNETANFRINGYCTYNYYARTTTCLNNSYYPMTFVQTGLPKNVTWGVTILDPNGTVMTNQSANKSNGFLVPSAPVQFTVWTVPDPKSGKVWVPSTDLPSPAMPPQSSLINVRYTLESASSATFLDRFNESGLPAGSSWTLQVNGQSFGVEANNTTMSLAGGGPDSVNGSAVYQETGYGYYAASVTVTQYAENSTVATQTTTPGKVTFNGSALVTINYKPLYLVTTAASVGGAVTPATGWVRGGSSVQLNVTALPKYHFVSWTGSGAGSTTVAQAGTKNPLITPKGPVTEFATFRLNPLPTWNITISGLGLPSGTNFTVGIGVTSFAGSGSFKVGYIVGGLYALNVPYVYENASQTTRYVPTSIATSLAIDSTGLLNVSANGTLNVTYTTQYLLQISSTPAAGGSITPVAGEYWENAGSVLALSATPARHYYFVGWNATTSAGITSAANTVSLTMTSPVIQNAQFAWRPVGPPATYWIQVTAGGLPKGLSWNVSLGSFGASGNATTLTVNGLNGTYSLSLPDLYVGAGTRFVSTDSGKAETVTSNSTATVSFTEQFLVTVTWSAGGSATPSSEWVAKGTTVSLTATPANSSVMFDNWTGNGYAGTNPAPSFTVNGPVNEIASFSPVFPQKTTTQSAMGGQTLSFGLLAALLVVGLTAGILLSRRGRRPRAPPETWSAPAEEPVAAEAPTPEYVETPSEEPES